MNFFTQLWQWLRPVAESTAEDVVERKLTNQPITAADVLEDIATSMPAQTAQPAANPAANQLPAAPTPATTNNPQP